MTPKTKTTYSHPTAENCPSISVILSADAPVQFSIDTWWVKSCTAEELDAFMELCAEVRQRHTKPPSPVPPMPYPDDPLHEGLRD